MFLGITMASARQIFPSAPLSNLEAYLPGVLHASERYCADRNLLLVALATIRAETEVCAPLSEQPSRWNTSPDGKHFDLYDFRKDLGNTGPPDGERFRGRGYVQLTGRVNYERIGTTIGHNLNADPEAACAANLAATILFQFLTERKDELNCCLIKNDLCAARRLVNGGRHGLTQFTAAFTVANSLLPKS